MQVIQVYVKADNWGQWRLNQVMWQKKIIFHNLYDSLFQKCTFALIILM